MNKILCNPRVRYYIVNSNEIEFHLPHFENIILLEYDGLAEIWNQIIENEYKYNENDSELIHALIESGVLY